MQPPHHIAHGLAQYSFPTLPQRMRTRVGTWRNIHLHSFVLKQLADAENVIRITNRYATVHVIRSHDHANSLRGLRRVGALGFGNQAGVRDATMHQVIVAHSTFTETRISRRPAGRNHYRSDSFFKQVKSMIEAGPV